MLDDNKSKHEDCIRLREEVESLDGARAEDKQIASQKYDSLAQEYDQFKQETEQREEQDLVKFMDKENKLV